MLFSNLTGPLCKQYGLVRAVEMMQDAGFPAVDITMAKTHEDIHGDNYRAVARRLVAISERTGLQYVQAHAPYGGHRRRFFDEQMPYLPRAFEFCSLVGIPAMVVHPLVDGRYYMNADRFYDMNMEFYSSLIPMAKACGVKILIENMWDRHPVTGNICDSACAPPEEMVRYFDGLNDPDTFGICLDLGHVALCGREPEDAICTIGHDRLGYLHVHDVDYVNDLHTIPGAGRINWDNVCRALGEIDYTGVFNMEVHGIYSHIPSELHMSATRYFADTARTLADRLEQYRVHH